MSKLDRYVHEYIDDDESVFWAVGRWSQSSGHYERPLDSEERRLTYSFAESGPLSCMPRYRKRSDAIKRAKQLWPDSLRKVYLGYEISGTKGTYLELEDGRFVDTVSDAGEDLEELRAEVTDYVDEPMLTEMSIEELEAYAGARDG